MDGKVRCLSGQGKVQGCVMGALPILWEQVLNVMTPEAMAHLLNAWYGGLTLAVMAVAIAIGSHFIRRITNIDV